MLDLLNSPPSPRWFGHSARWFMLPARPAWGMSSTLTFHPASIRPSHKSMACILGTRTDISDSSQITKLWGAEFEAFTNADGLTRRRLLELYAASTDPTLTDRLAAFADRAAQGAFAKKDGAEHAGMSHGSAIQTSYWLDAPRGLCSSPGWYT